MNLVVWVLWGKIKVDFNDVKHIVHLIGRFNELTNTIDLFAKSISVVTARGEGAHGPRPKSDARA